MFSGRTAMYHGLGALGLSAGQSVLVPAFHCASLVDPIRRGEAKAAFLQVKPDCSPDVDDIRRRADASTRAIVAIHYFGFPQALQPLRELLRRARPLSNRRLCACSRRRVRVESVRCDRRHQHLQLAQVSSLYDGGQLVINNAPLTSSGTSQTLWSG
jgi:DegT/DnrJ/EryC1/StrS aminotransferase family protein